MSHPHEETIILSDVTMHQKEQDSEFIAEESLLWGSDGEQSIIPSTANKGAQSQDQIGFLTAEAPEVDGKQPELI